MQEERKLIYCLARYEGSGKGDGRFFIAVMDPHKDGISQYALGEKEIPGIGSVMDAVRLVAAKVGYFNVKLVGRHSGDHGVVWTVSV